MTNTPNDDFSLRYALALCGHCSGGTLAEHQAASCSRGDRNQEPERHSQRICEFAPSESRPYGFAHERKASRSIAPLTLSGRTYGNTGMQRDPLAAFRIGRRFFSLRCSTFAEKIGAQIVTQDLLLCGRFNLHGSLGGYFSSSVLKASQRRLGNAEKFRHLLAGKAVFPSELTQFVCFGCHGDTYGIGPFRKLQYPTYRTGARGGFSIRP